MDAELTTRFRQPDGDAYVMQIVDEFTFNPYDFRPPEQLPVSIGCCDLIKSTNTTRRSCAQLEEIGAMPSPPPCEATRRVVEAYIADKDLEEITTGWPQNSGEVLVDSLTRSTCISSRGMSKLVLWIRRIGLSKPLSIDMSLSPQSA